MIQKIMETLTGLVMAVDTVWQWFKKLKGFFK